MAWRYSARKKRGTTSAAQTVVLSNTGNSELLFTKAAFTGSNAADFSLDANPTSCLLTPGSIAAKVIESITVKASLIRFNGPRPLP